MRRSARIGGIVREGVEAALDEHAHTFCGQQAEEASPGERARGYERVKLCCGSRVSLCDRG